MIKKLPELPEKAGETLRKLDQIEKKRDKVVQIDEEMRKIPNKSLERLKD